MSEHTPSPLIALANDGNDDFAIVADVGGKPRVIGEAYAQSGPEEFHDAKANATLWAAAPDLLAALRGVLRVADRATDEFDAARAAVAKAEGK